jgi:hypothetical protein
MKIHEMIECIETKEQFLEFLATLKRDSAIGDGWENGQIETFLDAMHAWASDMGERVPAQASWRTFADILYAGKIYE